MLRFVFEKYLEGVIGLFYLIGLAEWKEKIEYSKVANRTVVIIKEAKKRKIKIEQLYLAHKSTKFFKAIHRGKSIIFEALPLGKSYCKKFYDVDNKWLVKNILKKNNFLVPDGQFFKKIEIARNYAKILGFPQVVKPVRKSLSEGVNIAIADFQKLEKAFEEIKKLKCPFLVERYVEGKNYRATLVGGKFVAACERIPANVIGDGRSSIADLIEQKNSYHLRGGTERLDFTLRKIQPDQEFLENHKIDLSQVPKKGEMILLGEKVNLGSGADVVDVTKKVHSKNKKIFENVSNLFDAHLLGIDLISKDLSKPFQKEPLYIIELNSLPYIDMHHFPWQGKPINVAAKIWDEEFGEL